MNDDEEDLITNWDAPDMHTNSGVEPSMRSFDPETGQKGRLETSTGRSSTHTSTGVFFSGVSSGFGWPEGM